MGVCMTQVEQLERESVAEVSYTEVAREKSSLVIDCVTPLDQGLIHCVGVSADKMVISQPTVLNVLGTYALTLALYINPIYLTLFILLLDLGSIPWCTRTRRALLFFRPLFLPSFFFFALNLFT